MAEVPISYTARSGPECLCDGVVCLEQQCLVCRVLDPEWPCPADPDWSRVDEPEYDDGLEWACPTDPA